ncbi:MAG: PKD domain-containing protein, partial [Actinomycetota bacterium]|nr:PKD domain-containing protein [Actinomycetota bacterium]
VEVPRTGPDGTEDPTTEVEAGEAPGGVDPVPGGSEPVAAGDGQPDPPADPATTTPDTTVPGDELEALFAVSADLVEVGTEVRFEDRSSGEPTSWEWDFDDGGTASGERAAHTWDEAGTYRVVLTVTDEDGETRTRARDITVENDAPLRAGFRAEARAEVGEEVQLLDDSVGEPDEWLWTFDDDTTSTDQDPTHRWRRAGVFVVTLEVRRGDRTDAVQHSIEIVDVIEPPEARFESPTRARTGVDIQFADRSTGDPTSWEWDFGDGSGSTRVNPVHRYRDEGEYTVGLTVANSAGESEEFTRRLVVEDPTRLQGDYRITSSPPPRMEVGDAARLVVDALVGPAVDLALPPPAGATPPCELADVTRNGTTVSASVRGVAAGPCRIDITQPPSTGVDPAPGRSIRVEVGEPAVEIDGTLSLNGETGTLRTTVGFAAPLNIGFDLVTDPADVAEYRWSFGNGRETVRGSATGGRDLVATAPGGFFRSGDQTFELVVLADSGERTRVTMPISIAPPPLEIVPPPTVVAGRAATFGASSGDVPVSSWTWHFDDGSPPVAQPPGGTEPARTEVTHTFPSAGRFSARVVLDTGFETVARQVAFDVEEPGGADLVIVSVSGLTVASCPGGDMVAVTVTVRNDGNVTSEARPSGGPLTVSEIGGGLGGGAPLPAIPAGATAEVRVGVPCANQQLCPPYAGATVSYRAEISASVGPPETNTANNVSAPFSVTYPVGLCDGYGGADLVIVSVTDVAVSQCPGVKVTVSVSVRNDGTVASEPRPGVGAVQFGQPGTNLGQGVGLPSIAPGQTVTVPISVACGDEAECAPYAGSTVAYEARIGASGPPQTNTANDVFGPVNVTYPPGLCDGYAPTGETTS